MSDPAITIEPLIPERWPDLETVFGPNGAIDGCWCMWFRKTGEAYNAGRGANNRSEFAAIVASGAVPGLLAYVDGEPAAWCAVQPRDAYPRLNRSRVTKSLDGSEAWAVVCFVTRKEYRGRGLNDRLLAAAVAYAASRGARLVEGFPVEVEGRVSADVGFHGFARTFHKAGFEEVARRNPTRPYMRRAIG